MQWISVVPQNEYSFYGKQELEDVTTRTPLGQLRKTRGLKRWKLSRGREQDAREPRRQRSGLISGSC